MPNTTPGTVPAHLMGLKMTTYKIVYRAGAYVGGCVGETTGDAETAEEALNLFGQMSIRSLSALQKSFL